MVTSRERWYGHYPALTVTNRPYMRRKDAMLQMTTKMCISTASQNKAISHNFQNSTILTVAVVTFRFSKNFTIACHRSTPSPFSPICDRQTFQISSLYAIEKGFSSSDFSSEISCNKNLRTSKSPIPRISSYDVTDYDSVQNSLPKVHKNSSLL